ncbi:MAG TPA: hypothetical protein VFD03_01875 [Clostridia bacterium]|nr:hypothetical protein [Clostridia bacterium]
MSKKLTKNLALIIAMTFVVTFFAGCGQNKDGKKEVSSPTATATTTSYYDMYDKVQDSSELPDWTGKQLNLKVWYTDGTGDAKRNTSDKDVVTPEIKRVTGVGINKDTSFDNAGQTVDIKLGMLNAASDWPDVAIVNSTNIGSFKDMFAAGIAYDLTDSIAKYAPNLAKKIPFDTFPEVKNFITNHNQDGKIYAYPLSLGSSERSIKMINPSFVNPNAQCGLDGAPTILIRDDILKMLYPNAKTQDEIEALYLKNGTFTKDEIYDVPLKTRDDVVKLLYDVQNLIKTKNLKENGKPIQTTFANSGGDNWFAFAGLLLALDRIPTGNNYFTYYDKTSKSIQFMFQQDFFKDTTKLFNKFVRDGVMDKNSLLENSASHLEELNNGQYAIAYVGFPDETVLKAAGKTFRYRALWIDSPVQDNKFLAPLSPITAGQGVVVFKDKVAKEDVTQIIRYLDYLVSDVGEKMYTWGPKSAGLFEEKDGKRVFLDKGLEDSMVYAKDNGKALSYNLTNNRIGALGGYGNAWPYYPTYMWGGSTLSPVYAYDKVKNAADGKNFFDPGNLPDNAYNSLGTNVAKDHNIWSFFGSVPSVDKFWKGRDAFEKALLKTLAAKDDAQFEQLWKDFSDLSVKNGATPETLKEINDSFVAANKGYLGY